MQRLTLMKASIAGTTGRRQRHRLFRHNIFFIRRINLLIDWPVCIDPNHKENGNEANL